MSEPMKPRREGREDEKRDGERHAFLRVAPRLEAAFPHLGICIPGDALHACAPLMKTCGENGRECIFTFKEGRTRRACSDARELMSADPSKSGRPVGRTARGRRVECGRLSWANGAAITRGCDQWQVFDVVKVEEDRSNGHPCRGRFATGPDVRDLREAEQIGTWGRRRRNIESGFHAEKNNDLGLGRDFCDKARASRSICLVMQMAYNLWRPFNVGCLRRPGRNCRNMTQRKWAQIIREALMRKGIELGPESVPRRCISREFMAQ